MLAWSTDQVVALAALASLVLSLVAIGVGIANSRAIRAQHRLHRDLLGDDHRRDEQAQRDRAGRLRLVPTGGVWMEVSDEVMTVGDPVLKITNKSDVTVTAIDVAIESNNDDTPHMHVEHIPFLVAGERDSVQLPRGPAGLMVTWRDPDGAVWRRRHVGVEFILERLN